MPEIRIRMFRVWSYALHVFVHSVDNGLAVGAHDDRNVGRSENVDDGSQLGSHNRVQICQQKCRDVEWVLFCKIHAPARAGVNERVGHVRGPVGVDDDKVDTTDGLNPAALHASRDQSGRVDGVREDGVFGNGFCLVF